MSDRSAKTRGVGVRILGVLSVLACQLAACSKEPEPRPTPAPVTPPPAPKPAETAPPTPPPQEAIKDAAKEIKEGAAEVVEEVKAKVEEKVELITAETRALVETYLKSVGDATGLLSGVSSPLNAAAAIPKAKPLLDSIRKVSGELSALPADVQGAIRSEYGERLGTVGGSFQAQVDRLSSDRALSVVGELVKGISLFK